MFKILILISLLTLTAMSQTIHFSEEKYHAALETSFNKEGNITFLDDRIEVIYFKNRRKLIYQKELLTVEKEGKKEEIDLRERPEVKIFFTLFRAIYFDDQKLISSFFTHKEREGINILSPQDMVSHYIEQVRYKRDEKKLIFLEINFVSRDRIHIEELD